MLKNHVPILDDPVLTLREWAEVIKSLTAIHGSDAVLSTDAGYNNVSFYVQTVAESPPDTF